MPPGFLFYYDRPKTLYHELVSDFNESSNSDELYEPEEPLDHDEEGDEYEPLEHQFEARLYFYVDTTTIRSGGESSDEQFQRARENLRGFINELFEVAGQLQKEAREGRLGSRRKDKSAS